MVPTPAEALSLEALAALPDAVLRFDRRSLRVLDVNRLEALYGRPRREVLGSGLAELVPGATAELLEAAIARRHDPHPDAPLRMMARWADGSERPIDVKASAETLHTGLAVLRDVSESARIAERELVTVICSAPEAIITWLPGGRIVSWNPAAERLYGLSAAEAIGSSIERIVPAQERAELARAERTLLDGGAVGMREVIRLRGAQEVLVGESLFVVRDHGTHPRRVGSFSRDLEELGRLRQATRILSRTSPGADATDACSPRARELYQLADRVARDAHATVLLLGETGVGKTHLARRIHARSPRVEKPFLELNCSTLEGPLLDSELFGHERGAFTGAHSQKRGLVEVADGGTLLLDEIGELPPATQAKLLSFLDDRRFRRLGGTRTLSADLRIVAATNADLARAVDEGRFRKDLYYRLCVCVLELPPLRERREELPALAAEVLRELRGRAAPMVGEDAIAALHRYAWPGNLRELRNVLERALLFSEGRRIELAHLPGELRAPSRPASGLPTLAEVELLHIRAVLASTGGNRSRTAELLGIDRSTLRRRLNELESDPLPPPDPRASAPGSPPGMKGPRPAS